MNDWKVVLLSSGHDAASFDCGVESLNTFLRQYAGQNARKGINKTHVALYPQTQRIAGFYTLSAGSISFSAVPPECSRRLPNYPIPTVHLGRLAVDKQAQGKGLGGLLLLDAIETVRRTAESIGIFAVSVDALDDNAVSFYRSFGFIALLDDPRHLFLPIATIRKF